MIQVYYANTSTARQNRTLEQFLSHLPPSLTGRARRYRSPEAAFNFVLGRYLLRQALTDAGFDPGSIEQIRYSAHDKPFLNGCFFSISHSQHLVACAFSRTNVVGLDIEVLRTLYLPDLELWFTAREWEMILAAADPQRQLLLYWTRKESVLKAVGGGLSDLDAVRLLDAKTARYENTGVNWYLQELQLEKEAVATLCIQRPDSNIRLMRLDYS